MTGLVSGVKAIVALSSFVENELLLADDLSQSHLPFFPCTLLGPARGSWPFTYLFTRLGVVIRNIDHNNHILVIVMTTIL